MRHIRQMVLIVAMTILASSVVGQMVQFTGSLKGKPLKVSRTGATQSALEVWLSGTQMWVCLADGKMTWAGDTNLYRLSSNVLRTDDTLWPAALKLSSGAAAGKILSSDANGVASWIEASALTHTLTSHTDWPSGLTIDELGYLGDVTSPIQSQLNAKAPTASPAFTGTMTVGGDVNLYRSAADVLKTDDSLYVAGEILVGAGGMSPIYLQDGLITSEQNLTIDSENPDATVTFGHASPAGSGVVRMVSGAGGWEYNAPTDSAIYPKVTGVNDLGHSTYKFRNLYLSGLADGVKISTHDHSTGTAQTRLAAKDRIRTLTWSPSGTAWPWVFAGNGEVDTGYLFPYPAHVTRVTLSVLFTGVATHVATAQIFREGSGITGFATASGSTTGWARGILSFTGAGEAFGVTDEFTCEIAQVTGAPSRPTVIIEYTVD